MKHPTYSQLKDALDTTNARIARGTDLRVLARLMDNDDVPPAAPTIDQVLAHVDNTSDKMRSVKLRDAYRSSSMH